MTPCERVVELLRERRRLGEDFDTAWRFATAQVLADDPRAATWRDVLEWSRPAYRRAFLGLPRLAIDWISEGIPLREGFTPEPAQRVELVA